MFNLTRMALATSTAAVATLAVSPIAQAETPSTWMNFDLKPTVHGQQVDLQYSEKGVQHYFKDGAKEYASHESLGYQINYGDDTTGDGANGAGGSTCSTSSKTAAFSGTSTPGMIKHKYAKPGTYTITAVGYYCGGSGEQKEVTKSFSVTVGGGGDTGQPAVSARAHLRYSVSGMTATLTPYVTGTQHYISIHGRKEPSALPTQFEVSQPKGAAVSGGNVAGDAGAVACTTQGSAKLSSAALSGKPLVYKFAKPGTYPVTLKVATCGDKGDSTLTKTVNITVPGRGSSQGTGSSTSGNGSTGTSGSATNGSQPSGSATGTVSQGPKVNTDDTGSPLTSKNTLLVGGGALVIAGAGGATLAARRRRSI